MKEFYMNQSKESFVHELKEYRDKWYPSFQETYRVFQFGSYFLLSHMGDHEFAVIKSPGKLFCKITEENGKTRVRFRRYYGLTPRNFLLLALGGSLYYFFQLNMSGEDLLLSYDSRHLILQFVIAFLLTIPFAFLVDVTYSNETYAGQEAYNKIRAFLYSGGKRYSDLDITEFEELYVRDV